MSTCYIKIVVFFLFVCDFSIVQTWLYENLVPVYLYTLFTHNVCVCVCALVSQIRNRECDIDTEAETILLQVT